MENSKDKDIQEKLSKRYPCFVLITCEAPLADGNMNIQMHFEGDPLLASMMVQGAQSYLEERQVEQDLKN